MKLEPDAWLSEIFGYGVFRVTISNPGDVLISSVAQVREALCANAEGGPAFFYAKIPARQVEPMLVLTRGGFSAVDVNVILRREPPSQPAISKEQKILVRNHRPEDQGDTLAIAASCFVYSRFHLDPQIPTALANRVKRAWVDSYFQGRRGERLLVAVQNGQVVGFLAVLNRRTHNASECIIDLVGVNPTHQGRGVGRKLVEHFINDSVGRDIVLTVGTQVANIPSIRLYESCGFRMADATYVLHAHVREHELVR